MVLLIFRFLAFFLIVAGIMLLGADAISTLEAGGEVRIRTVESVWGLLSAGSLEAVRGWVSALPETASSMASILLQAPSWIAFGLLGVILAYFFGYRDEAEEE